MATTTLYGIKSCDTVRKARHWLDQQGITYTFHDFRIDGLSPDLLNQWNRSTDWETLLNRRGTSWRQLPDKVREKVNEKLALELMLDNPTLIKRPVLTHNRKTYIGFSADTYKAIFK